MRLILILSLAITATLASVACGPPIKNTPVADIPKLATIEEVMDNQATTADPEFKKIDNESYTDADYAAFTTAAERISATSLKTKDVTKGAEFDALAVKLHDQAEALGKAAAAKDAAAAKAALSGMKAACKECHSKFR
ncbi:MAG: cytochrome c [Polyangiaceae bacterium]|nr:cytochrome c [Polyangiaceae bacterium]